ncbi:MAG: hypothetical protein Kow0092_10690 [Deferrisomatales bacterium]
MTSRAARLFWTLLSLGLLAWGIPTLAQSVRTVVGAQDVTATVDREVREALNEHREHLRQVLREQGAARLRQVARQLASRVEAVLGARREFSDSVVRSRERLREVGGRSLESGGWTALVALDDLRLLAHPRRSLWDTPLHRILGDDPRLTRLARQLRKGEPVEGLFGWPDPAGGVAEVFLYALPVSDGDRGAAVAAVAACPFQAFVDPVHDALTAHDVLAEAASARARARIQDELRPTAVVSTVSVVTGAFLLLVIWSTWSRSVTRLARAARRVARGDFDVGPELDRLHAVGPLGEALASMVEHLKRTTVTREYLHQVVEGIPAAILATDAAGKVVLWNEHAREITGYGASDVLGRSCREIPGFVCGADDQPCPRVSGFPLQQVEMTVYRKDGREVVVAKSSDVLPQADGGPPGTIEVFFDVTEKRRYQDLLLEQTAELQASRATALQALEDLKRAVAELERARDAAEEGSRLKSEFLANVSHEIRTPLNAIIGFANLLRDGPLFPEEAEYADIIVRSSEHLRELIDQVLDLSKVEAGRVTLNRGVFDPRTLLEAVEGIFRPRAEERGLRFVTRVDEGVPRAVTGDGTRIRQVLINLVTNAVKFTEQGSVDVAVGWEHPDLVLTVSDTGAGIPEAQLGRVFEPFYQVDGSANRRHGGTGLGLAIVQGLVRTMGGAVAVESQVGEGTTFRVRLPAPRAREEAENAESPGEEAPAPSRSCGAPGGRVLLVENDPPSALLVRTLLEQAGYEVVWAEGGEEGLRRFEEGGWDALLLDMQMPGVDGYEVARRIRGSDRRSAVPVVALTAHAMEGDRQRCLEAGCSHYLPKPVDRRALVELLGRIIGQPTAGGDLDASVLQAARAHYLSDVRRAVEALGRQVAQGDLLEAGRVAHTLKGSGGTYGFPEITEAAGRLDRACRAGDRAEAAVAVQELQRTVGRLPGGEDGEDRAALGGGAA